MPYCSNYIFVQNIYYISLSLQQRSHFRVIFQLKPQPKVKPSFGAIQRCSCGNLKSDIEPRGSHFVHKRVIAVYDKYLINL